jgi:MFS family permease
MRPVRTTFIAFGFFWGTWAVAAFDVQRFLELSDGQLGLLLAATVVGGALANMGGGVLSERLGTRLVLSAALAAWGCSLLLLSALTHHGGFMLAFLVTVGVGGLVDVAMNVAATAALGTEPVRLLRLHALFNVGALAGAATAGVLLNAGFSFRVVWVGVAVVALLLAAWVRTATLPAGDRGESHTLGMGIAEIARAGLIGLAVVFAIGATVEGGIATWGVLFLRSHLGLAAVAGAGAYVVGQALATIARVTLGRTAGWLGERRAAQTGLTLAGAGLLLEAVSTHALPASVGLAAAAIGSAVYWPLLLAHASAGSERPGLVVGGLSAAGYVGFLAGPPLVGWVSNVADLRWGLAALGGAALLGAVLPLRERVAAKPAVRSR